jgi:hypothetical protein
MGLVQQQKIRNEGARRRYRGRVWHPWLLAVAGIGLTGYPASAATDGPISIALGHSIVPLYGPWRFQLGDDPRWADAAVDDAAWEPIDLTPARESHDADVGLTGYVPGWSARGHPGYSGYAWYRLRIAVSAAPGMALALAGPADVDSAYQVFFNGRLLGGAGDFCTVVPTVYSIQPRIFPLPAETGQLPGTTDVIAFRVWMGEDTADESPDTGGIHIAPVLGEQTAIQGRYQEQWLQTIRGYVVDLLEPVAFALLAVMAWLTATLDRTRATFYRWLIMAMLLTAGVRLNQVVYFWGQWESVGVYDWVRNGVLMPLGLGAWTMACQAWLNESRSSPLPTLIWALALAYLMCQCLTRPSELQHLPHVLTGAAQALSPYLRLLFLIVLALIVWRALHGNAHKAWYVLPTMLLMATGQFAQELSAMGVPGIWFPWGTGVSRTQFAYALFAAALFCLLLAQFVRTARSLRAAQRR